MHSLAFVVSEGFESMALAAAPVFEFANETAAQAVYKTSVVSASGGLVKSSGAVAVMTSPFADQRFHTVIVGGGASLIDAAPTAVLDFIRDSEKTALRIASICSGALVLAQAGVLEGRRATTHWAYAPQMRARYPAVKLDEDRIFVVDGHIWSSAGMTAGIDMALAMVEQDLGEHVAHRVAQVMVMYHKRAGGQSQHSALLDLSPKSDRIQAALSFARANLAAPLSVAQLADVANLSVRQFSRAFRAETGQTPSKAIEGLRLEAARRLLERGRHGIEQIAVLTGLGDRRRMREAFLRAHGVTPQAVRRGARMHSAEFEGASAVRQALR